MYENLGKNTNEALEYSQQLPFYLRDELDEVLKTAHRVHLPENLVFYNL